MSTAINTAAQDPANDTSTNPTSGLAVVQNAGVPVVTVASAPRVNFTVFSDGKVLTDLQPGNNARFIIAKLVRGTNGNPDQWQSYTWRTRTGAAVTDAVQHYLVQDGGPGSGTGNYSTAANLVYNAAGYYTFTYPIDITNPANLPPGVTWDPTATHRVAIQLRWTNAAGEDVRTQIYYDFTFDANGNSVPVTAAQTRKVVDVSSCNNCHNPLRLHGGRTDTQFCVLCHNPNTQDEVSGNIVDLKIMVHKIHAGRHLFEEHGEDYQVQSNHYKEVGFPANVRNCTKCHDESKSAQGDHWRTTPSKEVCLACHESDPASDWYNVHITTLKLGTSADDVTNAPCANCHGAGQPWNPKQVHWLQELENTALYQNNIESVTLTTAPTATTTGLVTVKYSVINPATKTAYNLREGCAADAAQKDDGGNLIGVKCNTNYRWYTTTPPGAPQDKFGTFSVNLATETLAQTVNDTTNTTSKAAYLGVEDGGLGHYTLTLTVPKGAHGNARVVMLGSVAEQRIDPITRAPEGAVPPTTHEDLAYVPVKNAIKELNILTGGNSARRMIVSNDKCNACHVYLGIPMDPAIGAHAFHSGLRNNSESCEICHTAFRAGTYTAMADGTNPAYNESWQARRFVHALHGRDRRMFAFSHGNDQIGPFDLEGNPLPGATTTFGNVLGGTTEVVNFTAEVAFPGRLADCNTCHVNSSWKQNLAVLGSQLVSNSTNLNAGNTAYINPGIARFEASGACVGQTGSVAGLDLACTSKNDLLLPVISPKASVCTACHDKPSVQNHIKFSGNGGFGTVADGTVVTQADVLAGNKVAEICDGCHQPGSGVAAADISIKHGVK